MSNRFYPKTKIAIMSGSINLLTVTLKFVLVDLADYTPNFDTHDFLDDVPAGARVATSGALASKTLTNSGSTVKFTAANPVFTAAAGDPCEAMILIVDTGAAATSWLVAYYDTAFGLPVAPAGADLDVAIPAAGIFDWAG